MERLTYIATTAAGGDDIALSAHERMRHIHLFGATGMGKSTLLKTLIQQDLVSGEGVLLVDPHGDLAEYALDVIPAWRTNQVCYFCPFDLERPVGFNVLESAPTDDRPKVAESVVAALRGIWGDSWGPRMEDILRYSLLALLAMPSASLAMLGPFLTNDAYRRRVLSHCSDDYVVARFVREFDPMPERTRLEWINPILNKTNAFMSSPALRNILGQSRSTLRLSHAMMKGHVVIANLAQGLIGDAPSSYLGALLIAQVKTAIMARAALPEQERRPFHLIVDEIQLFGTELLASIYSEARKYALSITAANQHSSQLSERVRDTILGNAGTIAAFRVGPDDADLLARRYQMDPSGLIEQSVGELFINGRAARTYDPPDAKGSAERVKAQSRYRYGKSRADVEARLTKALASSTVIANSAVR